ADDAGGRGALDRLPATAAPERRLVEPGRPRHGSRRPRLHGRGGRPGRPVAAEEGLSMSDRPMREIGKRAVGAGRHVYAAGALALTEPGPAAAGIVVADERGRLLSQRSHYLGQSTRAEATARALHAAARLALQGNLEAPIFHVDDQALVAALRG